MSLTIVNGTIQKDASSNNPFVAAGITVYPFVDINAFITGVNSNWFSVTVSNTGSISAAWNRLSLAPNVSTWYNLDPQNTYIYQITLAFVAGFYAVVNVQAQTITFQSTAVMPPVNNPPPTPSYSQVYLGHYTTIQNDTINFGLSKLKNVHDPTDDQDVSSKKYVDSNLTSALSTVASNLSAAETSITNAYTAADTALKSAVDAEIKVVSDKVDGILAGVSVDVNSLEKVAQLAQTLDAAETASLNSAVASLQSQITTNTTNITSLQTSTTNSASEFDTAKVKFSSYIDLEEGGPFNNSIKTDPATGNLVLSTPTANGSCVVNIPTNFFLTDTIGATSYSSVQFNNSIDMAGYYNAPKKIINLADGSDAHDACAYHQLSDYKTSNDAAVSSTNTALASEAFARQSQDNVLQSNITAEQTRAEAVEASIQSTLTGYATSFTSKLVNIVGDKQYGGTTTNGFETDQYGNLVVVMPNAAANSSALKMPQGVLFETDYIGVTNQFDTNAKVGFTQPIDMRSHQIKNIKDGSDAQDAVSYAQYSALQAQVLVLQGQLDAIYSYIFNTSPSVAPTR